MHCIKQKRETTILKSTTKKEFWNLKAILEYKRDKGQKTKNNSGVFSLLEITKKMISLYSFFA